MFRRNFGLNRIYYIAPAVDRPLLMLVILLNRAAVFNGERPRTSSMLALQLANCLGKHVVKYVYKPEENSPSVRITARNKSPSEIKSDCLEALHSKPK